MNPPWRNLFSEPDFQQRLSLIAVDEAHCILNGWVISLRSAKIFDCFMYNTSRDPDFRMCFQQLGGLRALTEVPIIALTATAPQEIKSPHLVCLSQQ